MRTIRSVAPALAVMLALTVQAAPVAALVGDPIDTFTHLTAPDLVRRGHRATVQVQVAAGHGTPTGTVILVVRRLLGGFFERFEAPYAGEPRNFTTRRLPLRGRYRLRARFLPSDPAYAASADWDHLRVTP